MGHYISMKILIIAMIFLIIIVSLILLTTRPQEIEGQYTPTSETQTTNLSLILKPIKHCNTTIIIDNNPDSNLIATWGLSILIDVPGLRILFDTGPNPEVLKNNMEVLGIDPRSIDIVVLSHEHGDHIGGLSFIAHVNPGIRVYVPSGMSDSVKDRIRSLDVEVIEIDKTTVIANGVAIIGEIYGPPWEQALAVYVDGKGLIVFVGCSHPGVANIVGKAINDLGVKTYMVIGGFHMAGASFSKCQMVINNLISYGIEYIAPIHCSGDNIRSILASSYPDHYIELHVGSHIQI
ncbi:MAG: MBL fold metallo-hydrolase [Thermoprotei archaeon]|nr:MAG: MBL fold metallo-hydrolase [Thermoprotei archaeon]